MDEEQWVMLEEPEPTEREKMFAESTDRKEARLVYGTLECPGIVNRHLGASGELQRPALLEFVGVAIDEDLQLSAPVMGVS
jgi:hypothetical protein